ncbi:9887_t:CDS:2 [Funneliformis geosporum]|uniref:9887_t:CDS:1 n=1 Tax=Funneliformis geosporum TaxID=1117311 RepID=A0A9W4WLX3_9GLOM|nr:9887_t:CDS:2 [Funneliformis geosporum]
MYPLHNTTHNWYELNKTRKTILQDQVFLDILKLISSKDPVTREIASAYHFQNYFRAMFRYWVIKSEVMRDRLQGPREMHVLHPIRADVSISPEIKLFISENIDLLPHEIYKRLVERGLDLNIRQNWYVLQNSQFKIREIGVDATYNTNNLKFELYAVLAEVDGIGVPLAYLFMEINGNYGNGI